MCTYHIYAERERLSIHLSLYIYTHMYLSTSLCISLYMYTCGPRGWLGLDIVGEATLPNNQTPAHVYEYMNIHI